jgi:chitin disaccharide deacetylase
LKPNPTLRRLGLAADDRAVIIHTDDIGMCQASLAAFSDLADFGLISSGATMVPCPWFPAVAEYCREHSGVDMGVHLTLNSEWAGYRWGPVSTRDPASGLLDAEGCLWRSSEEVWAHADAEAGAAEMAAQIERALAAGIAVTHIDTHMGTIAHPKFIHRYLQLARQHHLPPMIPRWDEARWQAKGYAPETALQAAAAVAALEAEGAALFDTITGLHLGQPDDRVAQAKAALGDLPPGLTHFIIHPSKDTPELRAITPDWRGRVADYETFMSEELAAFIRNSGLHVMGYRALMN